MSIFAAVEHLPYQTSKACQNALLGIEAIDYFFARQIVSSQQTSRPTPLTSQMYVEVFHVLLALSFFQRQGSVCISLPKIAGQSFWVEPLAHETLNDTIPSSDLQTEGSNTYAIGFSFSDQTTLVQVLSDFILGLPSNTYIILDSDRLYSKRYWQYELNLCRFIARNMSEKSLLSWEADIHVNQADIAQKMQMMFTSSPVENNIPDFQQLSVLNSLYSPFSIITGGAGTGKTYTITRLAVLLCEIRGIAASSIEMAAPTGKAANRLAQSLNNELLTLSEHSQLSSICTELSKVVPKTISRLLKINPTNGLSAYNAQRPLSAKLVIIDETSMIDISLMNKLINSLSNTTQLILVGDPNQLPSVETGCLLADLVVHPIGSMTTNRWNLLQKAYPLLEEGSNYIRQNLISEQKYGKSAVNRLSKMRRSSSAIADFSQAVLESNSKKALSLLGTQTTESAIQVKPFGQSDATIKLGNKHLIIDVLTKHVISNFSALFSARSVEEAFAAMKKYALLTPFRKSLFGTHSLNQLIEEQLRHHYDWIEPNKLYKCKPIMILQNDYQLSLFNGDLGVIWESDDKKKRAYFKTAKGLVAYPIYNLPAFDVNYAMTIHKTQGSEFESVDIILPNLDSDFLNKQLLYTGITRAQQRIRLFTDPLTLTQVIERSADRISGIDSNLNKAIDLFN